MLRDGGIGVLPKLLEAYMGETVCQPILSVAKQHGLHGRWPNMGVKLPSMLRVVVVLFWQHDDQLKIGLP